MKEIRFELETITPLFLHGADGTTAELRAPSIKGLMRYWWRAAKSEDNIKELKKQESEIFGSTDRRSAVSIRVLAEQNINAFKRQDFNEWFSSMVNQPTSRGARDVLPGLRYLLYSTFMLKDIRGYYDVGMTFSIILSSADNRINELKQAAASLWLLVYLGGLGMRSRRGGGNLAVKTIEDEANIIGSEIDFIPKDVNSKDDLERWLKDNLNKVKKLIDADGPTDKYSNLFQERLYVLKPDKTWFDCLNYVGEKYQSYRKDKDLSKLPAFGLPIVFRNGPKVQGTEHDRSASRLIFKVLKLKDQYYPLIIFLYGKILSDREKVKVTRGREHVGDFSAPTNKIIEYFIDLLVEEPTKVSEGRRCDREARGS